MKNIKLTRTLCFLAVGFFFKASSARAATLFQDTFTRPDGLTTNEAAFWDPTNPSSAISPDWELDSGSFFVQSDQGWSGVPDDCSNGNDSPNFQSSNCTDSAIFRLNTKRFDFNNVRVAFSLYSNGLTSTQSTPPVDWDGIHIFLRYQSEFNLYYASINRREQTAVLKKKCPGGTDNGGTYYELTQYVPHSWSPGVWQHVSATVQTNADNTVTIALYDDNGLVVQGIDNNIGKCAPITTPGAVGIRGDNNNFLIDDFTVTDLSTGTVSNPAPVLASVSPSSASAGGAAFTLAANGSGFVNGSIIQWNGLSLSTVFVNTNKLTAPIPAADIAAVGVASLTVISPTPGGGTSASLPFAINTPPTPTNPVPTLSSINPNFVLAGGSTFTLTLNGSNFINGSVAQWAGQSRVTTFVNSTRLTIAVPANDIAIPGSPDITVFNPAPGGGMSSPVTLTIDTSPPPDNPVPTLFSVTPSSVAAGGSAVTVSVSGSDFINGSVVQWNGAARATTFVNSQRLSAVFTAADVAAAGAFAVTVLTPAPGGGTSNAVTYTVNAAGVPPPPPPPPPPPGNSVPILSNLSPSSVIVGSSDFILTVSGSRFINGSVVQWNGASLPTTFVRSRQLTAAVPSADVTAQGTAMITVFTPAPGGGTSGKASFSITAPPPPRNPVPSLTSLSPASAVVGGQSLALTATGSGFVSGSVIRWNGSARQTVYGSGAQLTATITASDLASTGTVSVTVFSPSPGGGRSNTLNYAIVSQSTLLPVIRQWNITPYMPVNSTVQVEADNASTLLWTITPQTSGASQSSVNLGTRKAASNGAPYTLSTSAPVLSLASLALVPGNYSFQVVAQNSQGIQSSPLQADVTLVEADLANLRVFPSPWRSDKDLGRPITFNHLTAGAVIKIFTVSGRQVKDLGKVAGAATWDLTNDSGEPVASGIYIYLVTDSTGRNSRGKLAIAR